MKIERIDLPAEYHPHHVEAIMESEIRMHKKTAEDVQVGDGYAQDTAGFQDPVDFSQRPRQFLLIAQMLVDMGGVDFIDGAIGESGKVRATADVVHEWSGLDVEDLPAGASLGAADMQAEWLGDSGSGLGHVFGGIFGRVRRGKAETLE